MTAVESHRPHGSYVKYKIDDCRCPDCTAANSQYGRDLRARLEPPYVAAGTARDHVRELMAAGVGLKQIVKVSGVSQGAMWKLMYGKNGVPSKRIRRSTEQRLLAITPADAAAGAKVDATRSWVLLDELIAAGVPKSQIATHLGQRGPGLQLGRDEITARNAAAIADMHAAWHAGTVTFHRRDRWGHTRTITPPAVTRVQVGGADISELYFELADIVEARREQTWRSSAACRNRPAYLWFPARGDREVADAGLSICGACMVRDQCRAANLDQPTGTYGGLTAHARRALRQHDDTPLEAPAARCGSNAGYHQHRRRNEEACDACLVAHRHYQQDTRPTRSKVPA